jgi:hypothetical protein
VCSLKKTGQIRARLEHVPLRLLAQETCISKLSAAEVMKLLELWLCKVTVVHALQPCDLTSRINFSNWFLQSVHDGEVDPHGKRVKGK